MFTIIEKDPLNLLNQNRTKFKRNYQTYNSNNNSVEKNRAQGVSDSKLVNLGTYVLINL